jgi:hypothetical protein
MNKLRLFATLLFASILLSSSPVFATSESTTKPSATKKTKNIFNFCLNQLNKVVQDKIKIPKHNVDKNFFVDLLATKGPQHIATDQDLLNKVYFQLPRKIDQHIFEDYFLYIMSLRKNMQIKALKLIPELLEENYSDPLLAKFNKTLERAAKKGEGIYNKELQKLKATKPDLPPRQIEKLAIFQTRKMVKRYEELSFSCTAKKWTQITRHAAKSYEKFIVYISSSSSLFAYYSQNKDKDMDFIWWSRFGYEFLFQLVTSRKGAKIISERNDGLILKSAKKYGYGRVTGIADLVLYTTFFGQGQQKSEQKYESIQADFQDEQKLKELSRFLTDQNEPVSYQEQVFRRGMDGSVLTPSPKEDLETRFQNWKQKNKMDPDTRLSSDAKTKEILEKLKNLSKDKTVWYKFRTAFYKNLAELQSKFGKEVAPPYTVDSLDWDNLTQKDLENEDVKDAFLQAIMLETYKDQEAGEYITTGHIGADRYLFHAGYALALLPKDMFFSLYTAHIFCMGQDNVKMATLKAMAVYTANRLIFDQLYYWSRRQSINQ